MFDQYGDGWEEKIALRQDGVIVAEFGTEITESSASKTVMISSGVLT